MNDAILRSYLDAWAQTTNSTPDTVAQMIAGAHPDIRFSDVNSPNVRIGHEGIRAICQLATDHHPGSVLTYDDLLFDGRNWSIRWTIVRPRGDGTKSRSRGASAGSVAEDGRVIEQTDYWNMASIYEPAK
jgi:hypothetical protein